MLFAGRGRLLLLVGGVGCIEGEVGVGGLLEEPKPNGNAPREALDGPARSWSLLREMKPGREGLGGTRASFGGANLEARRGVKDCEREWVCDGVCCRGDRLSGADPEEGNMLRFGGEEERRWVSTGKSTFRSLLGGGVVGVIELFTLSLRFALYLDILSCS